MGKRITLLCFILMGVLSLGFGSYLLFFQNRGYVKTTAVIDHVDKTFTGYDEDNHEEYDYQVYVNFTVDGTDYQAQSDYYQNGYDAGKEITIYYNPANPQQVHGDSKGFGIYLMILGPILILVGIFLLIRSLA